MSEYNSIVKEMCEKIIKSLHPIFQGNDSIACYESLAVCLASLGESLKISHDQQMQIFEHHVKCEKIIKKKPCEEIADH